MGIESMADSEVRAKFGAPAMMSALGREPEAATERAALSESALAIARRFSEHAISPMIVSGIVRILEASAVFAIGLMTYLIYALPEHSNDFRYVLPLIIAPAPTLVLLQTMRAYDATAFSLLVDQLGRVVVAWTLVFACFAVVIFFFKMGEFYSRLWFAGWYLLGLFFLLAERSFLAVIARGWSRDGRLQRRAIIVGGGDNAAELIRSLEASSDSNIQICGIFDDRCRRSLSGDRPGLSAPWHHRRAGRVRADRQDRHADRFPADQR